MSKTIDERVVSMDFDNKNFENNVKTSLTTLEKLKESLKFTGATKGFQEINSSAKKVNMSGISTALDTIGSRFSTMEIVGVTALANISNSAVNAGKRMLSALTIDPIRTGLSEYETQINAIQTIMANTSSKGTTLDQVNAALDELNKYADMTIYNFTEMTRNIGTFTAAGIGLETSVSAIKGIANLAAVSGSNSQQASTAMYQLSQALASGTVKLMDWNSVVNAGMGGQVFQDSLKETARLHGVAIDQMITDQGSFRETLADGWLTSDILTETLAKFTGDLNEDQLRTMGYTEEQIQSIVKLGQTANDAATKVKTFTQLYDTMKEAVQSGWAKTWQLIIGDFDEAKELWTGLSDFFGGIINAASDARNNLLQGALSSKWETFTKQINEAGVSTENFQNTLRDTAKENNINLDDLIAKYGSLDKALRSGDISTNIIVDTLRKFAGSGSEAGGATEDLTNKLEYFQKVVNDVWHGDYANGEARVKALTDAGYEYNQVQSLVDKTLAGQALTLDDLSDIQLKNVGYTDEQVSAIRKLAEEADKAGTPINTLIDRLTRPTGRELIFDTIKNTAQPVISILTAVKNAWQDAFPPMSSDTLYYLIDGLHTLSEGLVMSEGTIDKVTRTLKGLFAILDITSSLLGGGFRIGLTILQEFLKAVGFVNVGVLDITARIGDAIVIFRDWYEQHSLLNNAIKIGVSFIVNMAKAIGGLLGKLYNLPVVQKGLANISESFDNMFKIVDKYLGGAVENIEKFTDSLGNMDDISLDGISKSLKEFFNLDGVAGDIMTGFAEGIMNGGSLVIGAICDIGTNLITAICGILGIHSPSREFKMVGNNVMSGLCEGIKYGLSDVLQSMGDVGSSLLSALKDIDFGSIFVMGSIAGLGVLLWKTVKILDKFATPIEGLGHVFEGVKGVLGSFSKLIDAKALETKTGALLNIAKAIGILAASLAILSKMDQANLWSAVGALSVLTIGMVALLKVTDKMNNVSGFGKLSILMLGVSSSLLIMSFAIKKLASIDAGKATVALIEMGAMIGGLTVIMYAYGKFVKGDASANISKAGTMILKMAVGIAIMAGVIKLIAGIPNDDIAKGLIVIASIELLFAGIMAVSAIAGNNASKAGSMLLKMSVAIGVLALSMKLIATMSVGDITKGLIVIGAVSLLYGALIVVSKVAGANASKAGSMFLKMSIAVGILVISIKAIAGMSLGDIAKGIIVIAAVESLFAAFIILSNFVGVNASKAGSMLLKMSVAIGILALTMKLLATISGADIAKGLVVIGVIEILFGAIIAVSMLTGRNAAQAGTMLLKMSSAILILVGAIALLTLLKPGEVAVAVGAISAIMACFAGLIAVTSLAKDATKTLTILIGSLAALMVGIALLTTLDQEKVTAVTTGLSLLMGMFALLVASTGIMGKSVGTLVVLTGVIAVLGVILYALSSLPVESTMSTAVSLSILLLALSGACLILAGVGATGPAAFIGIGALLTLIVSVGTLMVAIGALSQYFPAMQDFLDNGIVILEKIGYGLGSFFGNIIGGFTAGISSGLPEIGTNLSAFMSNIQPFIEGAKQVDASTMSGVKALAETILILTAADVLNGITSWLTGGSSLIDFANQLVPFGEGLKAYAKSVEGLDAGIIADSAKAARGLADVARALPNEGGLAGLLMGENDMGVFASKLEAFGKGLVAYSNSIGVGVDAGKIAESANAAKALADVAGALPNEGGWLAKIVGENDMEDFATKLPAFGDGLAKYSEALGTDLNPDMISQSAVAAKALADMTGQIPNSGGFFSWFTGNNDMSDFAAQLEPFGKGLKLYADQVKDLKPESVVSSTDAALALADIVRRIPDSGGFFSWFTGNADLQSFADNLKPFGKGIAAYAVEVSNIKPESTDAATKVVESLSKMMKTLDGVSTDGATTFKNSINILAQSNIAGFVKAFSGSTDKVSTVGADIANSMIAGINSKQESLTKAVTTILTAMITVIKDKHASFKTAGTNLFNQVKEGIKDSKSNVSKAVGTVLSSALKKIKGYHDDFYNAGAYLVSGFASGINENTYQAEAKAKNMANAASKAAKKALDERSPSKVFYNIGDFAGQGFVNALSDYAVESYNAGFTMADSARIGLSKSLGRITDIINSDIDAQPTIKPVLDLSDVSNGVGIMNSMFGINPSMDVLARVNSINSSFNRRQNETDSNIVSALNDLKKTMDKPSGDTYILDGVTYDDGSSVSNAMKEIVRVAKVERRK